MKILSSTVGRNQRGQVALFVALIFQVLFVFFAMVINIGLLVHHKINLQNSTDLAAYYGAMKQAEMMNAVGHINYQIRQAYKLMMFRYHQIGAAGEENKHPFKFVEPKSFRKTDDAIIDFEPSFCIAYQPVNMVNKNESYCRNLASKEVVINLPGDPNLKVVGAFFFLNLAYAMSSLSKTIISQAQSGCKRIAQLNWVQLARFINIYKMDLRNRKQTLLRVANAVSTEQPLDLDGKSIHLGTFKTFIKNLTYQNKESLRKSYKDDGTGTNTAQTSFNFINGLSQNGCGSKGDSLETPGWLSDVNIFPLFRFLDAQCGGDSAVKFMSHYINLDPDDPEVLKGNITPEYAQEIKTLKELVGEDPGYGVQERLSKSSLGYEKNPWCMAYVGVSATTTPMIPFSPFGSVKIEAKSFAKPFGGRIGPWYASSWPAGAAKSQGEPTDSLAAMRVDLGNVSINRNDPYMKEWVHNSHSRYAGDQFGARSALTMGQYGRALHTLTSIDLSWWAHPFDAKDKLGFKGTSNDPLAWDTKLDKAPEMREIEIAAIAPDQFDNTYYSIDPDFHNNYLQRLKAGYESGVDFPFRGDLGAREGAPEVKYQKYSIRDQVATAINNKAGIEIREKLTYTLADPFAVLSAWQSKSPDEHVMDSSRFAKCESTSGSIVSADAPPEKMTSGSCVVGGRTGYSVKLVDSGFLRSGDLELGGEGVRGGLRNPPPDDF